MVWAAYTTGTDAVSGTITADGTEQAISAPAVPGTFITHADLHNMVDGDITVVRAYKMNKNSGTLSLVYEQPYYGAQHIPNVQVGPSQPNGLTVAAALKFTIQQTAGTNRTYDVITETQ